MHFCIGKNRMRKRTWVRMDCVRNTVRQALTLPEKEANDKRDFMERILWEQE